MKRKPIVVKVMYQDGVVLPKYETEFAAGLDLKAFIQTAVTLKPLERKLIPTGIKMEIPVGYEVQIRPRSGLSLKKGLMAILGTIDADYRGDVGIIVINLSNEDYVINPGDRIAQMVLAPVAQAELLPALSLTETERGEGGFGSTGKK